MLKEFLSYEAIALLMFVTMLVMMFTGQRVFGAIGFVAAASALLVWGDGSMEIILAVIEMLKYAVKEDYESAKTEINMIPIALEYIR